MKHADVEEAESEDEQFVPPPSCWFETSNPIADTVFTAEAEAQDNDPDEDVNENDGGWKPPPERLPLNASHQSPAVGHTHPSPSWKEISSQVLPAAARELLSSSLRRIYHNARLSYSRGRWHRKYSDIGNNAGGFSLASSSIELPSNLRELPPFSSLPWVDRQLVQEWRTYLPDSNKVAEETEEADFERARTLVPNPFPRPIWLKLDVCFSCHKPFGPTRLRHHCRVCGNSFCHNHSSSTHSLPHLGYDPEVSERVCDGCKQTLMEQNLAERVAWRLARCRDYMDGNLTPYFETGFDSAEQVAIRITKAALAMARSVPLGAQATVAVETLEVLRKHGLTGIYGIMLREEFLAAADLLRRALGINKGSWPLSVHELSAAIFYSFAQHRALRGISPEFEHIIHAIRPESGRNQSPTARCDGTGVAVDYDNYEESALSFHFNAAIDQTDVYDPKMTTAMNMVNEASNVGQLNQAGAEQSPQQHRFNPVCDPVPDGMISSLLLYAPIALNFVYAEKSVDMQLLAAQQGWRLLYAFLETETGQGGRLTDRPASALFVHQEYKIACLAIRGTASINDVVTDIRQIPVPFPDSEPGQSDSARADDDDWTNVFRGKGFALCGMAAAAVNLFREHIDSLALLAKQGYRIRITGHSLGGGVATMVGVLVLRHFKRNSRRSGGKSTGSPREDAEFLRVYSYGAPSCVDAKLAESVDPFVINVVLHDDVFPRLTPTSCRGLLKHLLHIRETWVKTHLSEDLIAIRERAKTAWAPRFRQGFTLTASSSSIGRYYRKQIEYGKKQLHSAKAKLVGDTGDSVESKEENSPSACDSSDELEPVEHDKKGDEMNENPEPQLLLEFLGGADTGAQGIVIDGDEFFDAGDNLVEDEDDNLSSSFVNALSEVPADSVSNGGSWTLDIQGEENVSTAQPSVSPGENNFVVDDGNEAVVLEEHALPRMFLAGNIVHIYSHRGVYKAAYVPRTFRELRRISMAGNMLANHSAKAYYEGLLEVQTARTAAEGPPRWTAFDEDDTCCCCASRFTWASTSDSEAQEARDKHNCRSCGGLVCAPCSTKRLPIPAIGLTVAVRVCDRCYNDMGGISATTSSLASSFLAVDEDEHHSLDDQMSGERLGKDSPLSTSEYDMVSNSNDRPERQREKRSLVVDELASRIRSSALTTC